MPSEKDNKFEFKLYIKSDKMPYVIQFKRYMKSDKMLYLIYADIESLIIKIDRWAKIFNNKHR